MKYSFLPLGLISATAVILSACGGSNSSSPNPVPPVPPEPTAVQANIGLGASVLDESHRFDAPASRASITVVDSETVSDALDYTVKITNLTNNQPLSPVLVVLHGSDYSAFSEGSESSVALEYLAEGGDNSFLVTEAIAALDYLDHIATEGPVGPLSSQTLTFTLSNSDAAEAHISMLTMLVNTNDAFTGLNAVNLGGLSAGERLVLNGSVWDSGTEANTESSGTMPGPADGGEGFNAARDDIINSVRIHTGVVTNALAQGDIVR